MSAETNDDRQRRYDAMVQKIHASNSANASIMPPSGPAMASVSNYAPSESSVFKVPNAVNTHFKWARIETQVNIFTNAFRNNSDINKFFLKLWVRTSNEILHLSQQNLLGTVDEATVLEMLNNALKTKYYGNRVPRCISSQSQSDLSQIYPFGSSMNMTLNNTNRPFTVEGHPVPAGNYNPCVPMERLPHDNQSQMPARSMNPPVMVDRPTTLNQHEIFAQQNNMSAMIQERPFSLQSLAQHNNVSVVMRERRTRQQPSVQQSNMSAMMHERPSSSLQSSAENTNISIMMQDQTSTRLQSSAQNNDVTVMMREGRTRQQPSGTRISQKNQTPQVSRKSSLDKTQKVAAEVRRPGRKPKTPNETLNGSRALQQRGLDTTENISIVGSKGMTRSGRHVKSPNQFWKGIERRFQEPSIIVHHSRKQMTPKSTPTQDLNETLTLRNKVVVRKTPTQVQNGSSKNTPMVTIDEEEVNGGIKKKPAPKKVVRRKSVNKANKENEKKASPKSRQEQKNVESKSKAAKKAPTKRKTKDSELTISKRKKIEELLSDSHNLNSDSDELFEPIFHKKRPQTANLVLSPSNGMQSVKKAAAASTSKETPPAKFISQLIETEFAAPTPANKLPESKVSQVVKRVTKMVEKKAPVKATKKVGPVSDNNREDPIIGKILNNIVTSTFTTTTPSGNEVLAVFRGTEAASDEDDMSEDEDDDLF